MKTIEQTDYRVILDQDRCLLTMSGILRLSGSIEYASINELLETLLECGERPVSIDIRALEFINSSGIAMLSKFMIGARNRSLARITILGTSGVSWQLKSLHNLQRLFPALELEID